MRIKEFMKRLAEFRQQHGNLPVYVLIGDQLLEPDIAHSTHDYTGNALLSGSTWEDLGLTEPALIIDSLEGTQPTLKEDEEDEYKVCQCDWCTLDSGDD